MGSHGDAIVIVSPMSYHHIPHGVAAAESHTMNRFCGKRGMCFSIRALHLTAQHREVLGVAGDEGEAMRVRGGGDQGIGHIQPV